MQALALALLSPGPDWQVLLHRVGQDGQPDAKADSYYAQVAPCAPLPWPHPNLLPIHIYYFDRERLCTISRSFLPCRHLKRSMVTADVPTAPKGAGLVMQRSSLHSGHDIDTPLTKVGCVQGCGDGDLRAPCLDKTHSVPDNGGHRDSRGLSGPWRGPGGQAFGAEWPSLCQIPPLPPPNQTRIFVGICQYLRASVGISWCL